MNKTFKRILSSLMVVAMLLTAAPLSGIAGLDLQGIFGVSASAESYSGTCGENLTWTLDTETGELVISGEGEMWNYEWYNCPWWSYQDDIKAVVVSNGVTTIGDYAFYECSGITSAKIPDHVTRIGAYAFSGCNLTSVIIPSSVEKITSSFIHCDSIINFTVDRENQYFSSDEYGVLFNKDKTMLIEYPAGNAREKYEIPKGVTRIGYYAFFGSASLTDITIPDGVTEIDFGAFYKCISLTDITIPDSATEVGEHAFSYCENLTKVAIGNGVKNIYRRAFAFCGNLVDVTFGDSVTTIGEEAFQSCKSIRNITMPNSVTEVGRFAFGYCINLEAVTLSNRLSTIGEYVFGECISLTSVEIPNGIALISEAMFAYCENLKTVVIPESVTVIGDRAFQGCSRLTNMTIPNSVETIGESAFCLCGDITSVNIPDSVTEIGTNAFVFCDSLISFTVDSDNQYFSSDDYGVLFNKDKTELICCPNAAPITDYKIPVSVTSIGVSAFRSCNSLTNIIIGNSVITIGERAFSDCAGLVDITIPDSVKSIEHGAFAHCYTLKTINMGEGVEYIGGYAFFQCYGYADVYYNGTEAEWNEIEIIEEGNEPLLNANIHFLGDHNWDTVTVPSTCKVQGVSYDICLDCGDIQNYTVLPFAEHTWSEWTVVTEATTELEGLERRTCSVCGETEEEIIPKLNKLVDDESGVEIIYEDEYDSGIEIVVTDVYDGNSFNLIDKHFGSSKSMIFDITTVKDGQKVQPSGKVKVRIPLPDGYGTKGVYIVYIDPTSGKLEKLNATIVDGYIEFVTDHFSYYAVVEKLGKVNSVAIDNISMNYKDSATVTPTISVDAGVKYTVSYSSSDNGVAQVDANGKVTATDKGSATITVTVTDQYGNTVTDTCKVDVKYTWWQWIIVIVLFGWIWY